MSYHLIKNIRRFIKKTFAAEYPNNEGVNVLVRFAPYLALHVLEQTKRTLPIAAVSEFSKNVREIGEGELVLECIEAAGYAAAWREAGEFVD